MIGIVDYGMGNLASIANMLRRAGFEARLCSDAAEVSLADKLILPGVGSFDSGMASITRLGLFSALNEMVLERSVPVLGICLGMQLMLEGSDEGQRRGLGWLRGRCAKFSFEGVHTDLRVPHMGWNEVEATRTDTLFADMADDAGYYFVHSYYAVCANESDVLGWTKHGLRFAAAVQRANIFGTQFHPEKSHQHGMRLLSRFAEFEC